MSRLGWKSAHSSAVLLCTILVVHSSTAHCVYFKLLPRVVGLLEMANGLLDSTRRPMRAANCKTAGLPGPRAQGAWPMGHVDAWQHGFNPMENGRGSMAAWDMAARAWMKKTDM